VSYQGIEESVASEQIRRKSQPLHLHENLRGEVGLLPLNVGANGSVEKRSAWPGENAGRMEDEAVELVLAIGGDEGDEEGLGVGELVVGEEGWEDEEDGVRGVSE
jgi:hypothetical protein